MRIHKEGYVFIAIPATIMIMMIFIDITWSVVFACITAFFAAYFRDPPRSICKSTEIIISPADGKIHKISSEMIKDKRYHHLQIKLSIFDTRIIRNPCSGLLEDIIIKKGGLTNDCSDENVTLKYVNDDAIYLCIIAYFGTSPMIFSEPGMQVQIGKKCGILKFGSQIDIQIPERYKIVVREGQTIIGGETILAEK